MKFDTMFFSLSNKLKRLFVIGSFVGLGFSSSVFCKKNDEMEFVHKKSCVKRAIAGVGAVLSGVVSVVALRGMYEGFFTMALCWGEVSVDGQRPNVILRFILERIMPDFFAIGASQFATSAIVLGISSWMFKKSFSYMWTKSEKIET